jgi:hypothetical protein
MELGLSDTEERVGGGVTFRTAELEAPESVAVIVAEPFAVIGSVVIGKVTVDAPALRVTED